MGGSPKHKWTKTWNPATGYVRTRGGWGFLNPDYTKNQVLRKKKNREEKYKMEERQG